jgi:hypothetical protein
MVGGLGRPPGSEFEELGASDREHETRPAATCGDELLDEIEHRHGELVGILEREHDGQARAEPVDQMQETRLHVLDEGRFVDRALGQPQAEPQPGRHALGLRGIAAAVDELAQAPQRDLGRVIVVDARELAGDRGDG